MADGSDPITERTVTLTPSAAKRVAELIQSEGEEAGKFRIAVSGGGCSGFQYGFSFDRERQADDIVLEKNGAVVVIDSMSLPFIAGSTLPLTWRPKQVLPSSVRSGTTSTFDLGSTSKSSDHARTSSLAGSAPRSFLLIHHLSGWERMDSRVERFLPSAGSGVLPKWKISLMRKILSSLSFPPTAERALSTRG